jgi:hypothetical protein
LVLPILEAGAKFRRDSLVPEEPVGAAEAWQIFVNGENFAVKPIVQGENALACPTSNVQNLFWKHLIELRCHPFVTALCGKAAGVTGPIIYIRCFLGGGGGEIMHTVIPPIWCASRQQWNADCTQSKRRTPPRTPPTRDDGANIKPPIQRKKAHQKGDYLIQEQDFNFIHETALAGLHPPILIHEWLGERRCYCCRHRGHGVRAHVPRNSPLFRAINLW